MRSTRWPFALGGVLLGCGPGPAPDRVVPPPPGTVVLSQEQAVKAGIGIDTTRVVRIALPLSIPATLVTPDTRTAHVGSIVEGRVDEVLVLPGDRVAEGTPLVHIHSHELATAIRDLAAAEAATRMSRAAYDRSVKLLADEAVSREEVERRKAQLEQAEAERVRSREIVTHLSPSKEGAVVIRSPRAGTVFDVKVRPGEAVVVGAPLVTLGDASRLWATGFVPEHAALGLEPGDLVEVRFDAAGAAPVKGRVVRVAGIVDSLRRAVDVRVELASVPSGIKPGMFASLLVPTALPADRVVLPADAVQRTQDGDAVFIAESGTRFHQRMVQAVALPDGRMAIEGIPAGVPVVVRGAYALKSRLEAPAAGVEE